MGTGAKATPAGPVPSERFQSQRQVLQVRTIGVLESGDLFPSIEAMDLSPSGRHQESEAVELLVEAIPVESKVKEKSDRLEWMSGLFDRLTAHGRVDRLSLADPSGR